MNRCLLSLLLILSIMGCNNFFDVKPKERLLEDRVFQNAQDIRSANRGIYSLLASDYLYGGALTMGALDVMAQYYNCGSTHLMYPLASYQYGLQYADTVFTGVWRDAYRTILNLNNFIARLEPTEGVVDAQEKRLLLGESYGRRAMLHFDLLRIFGPVYRADPAGLAIPYQSHPLPGLTPIRPANDVVDSILSDIETCLVLMDEDPIRGGSAVVLEHNERFNYYAAMLLRARVLLYKGDIQQAHQAIDRLLTEAAAFFPLTDLLLPQEVVFRLAVPQMERQYRKYFSPTQTPEAILSPRNDQLRQIFMQQLTDVRWARYWRKAANVQQVEIDVFEKYAPPEMQMPVMRISEAWLIRAECEPDASVAEAYLNRVVGGRNQEIPDGSTVPFDERLYQEYRKEFWGEGQLFYFLKRKGIASIADGSAETGMLIMNESTYRVPIPANELIYR
ncbi:MAG: hypothetical protein EAS52_15740 [Parapedobacter sp.]|nr:MAG: hypothetical protein EAS52_15740 [Parapedobacter sp.]